jgi:[ribosomal protein S5]-alanine N-acetyltransferase
MRHLGAPLDATHVIERADDHWAEHGFGPLALEDKETRRLVGRSGLAYHRMWADDPEVGWWVDPAWWGRGLATEAGAASVRWGFETLALPRLVSICVEDNLASRRVMEKLEFSLLTRVRDPHLDLELWIHAREARLRRIVV